MLLLKSELTLDDILLEARADSVEFPYLLANHAPMVLIALDRLGASPARIGEWYVTYKMAHTLPPIPEPRQAIAPIGWENDLGNRDREGDYRRFFTDEVLRLGLHETVGRYVPHLVYGVAASALHPLMRLAYAVLKEDQAEAGAALGYWAACYLPLPAPGAHAPETDDPAAILAGIAEIEGIRDYQTETDLLWHNIRAVGALAGFRPVVDRLAFGPQTPRRMAQTALSVYAATMDFSALHAVTGLHWVRLVAPYLEDPEPLYRAFWQVIASLVPKIGFPAMPSPALLAEWRDLPAPDWADIKAAAIASDDEHDVSLVFSASQEEKIWGDPLYRVVAARRVGLID